MTSNVRILLAQIAVFEQQHRAGLNPPVTALTEFFDQARLVRLDIDALDRGLVADPAPAFSRRGALLERVGVDDDTAVVLRASVPIATVARLVLDELQRASRGSLQGGA